MTINGDYSNVGKDMVRALQTAGQDNKIERSEIAQLRAAAHADQQITEGEAALLQALELATEDGQDVHNFGLSDFNPADLEFGELSLRVEGNQAVVFPDEALLERRAAEVLRESTNTMDLGQSVDAAREADRSPSQFFTGLSREMHAQADDVEALLTRARELDPPPEGTVQRLEQIHELSEKMADVQAHFARSHQGNQGIQQAEQGLRLLQDAQNLLAQIEPEALGAETHGRLTEVLQEQASLLGRFEAEHEDNYFDGIWPDESLNHFVMRKSESTERGALEAPTETGPALDDSDRLRNFRQVNALPGQLDGLQESAQQALVEHFDPYLEDASAELRAYLNDPQSVDIDDAADVREEFADLFEDNPALAGRVGQELAALKDEFPALRQELESQLARAEANAQPEFAEELRGQLRSLADAESQIVRNWQSENQLLLEGLTVAAQDSDAVASRTSEARAWIESTQNRYASAHLEDPHSRQALAEGFEASLSSDAATAIREKIEKTTRDYGEPVRTVPMALVSDGTGAIMNFNAYVYQDGDDYFALNPMDQKFYRGATPEAALAELGRESRMLEGQLHYHDGQQMQDFDVQAPEDSSTWDMVMAGVGLVGAGVMICIPEPASSAAGVALGAAILGVGASSTYFVAKGAGSMHDLVQNDNFGNNRQTWMAAVDIASGLLGVAGAVGSGARLAGQGAQAAGSVNGVRNALTQSLQRLATSRGLMAAELADGAVGVGVAAEQIYQIANDPNLSDRQKQMAVSQIVMFTATPFVMAGVLGRNRAHDQAQLQQSHVEYMQTLRSMDDTLNASEVPAVDQVAKQNLEPMLQQMEAHYRSDALDNNPAMREEGLQQIAEMRAKLDEIEGSAALHETAEVEGIPPLRGSEPPRQSDDFQVNEALANDLRSSTESRAQEIVAEVNSNPDLTVKQRKRELNSRAALAEAAIEINDSGSNNPDGRVTSRQFENINDVSFAKDADPVPGTTRVNDPQDGHHRINDVDDYIDFIEAKYEAAGNELHPRIEAQIRRHIEDVQNNHDGRFAFFDGLPGLHAEVQAANDLLNQLEARGVDVNSLDMREVHIATAKLGSSNQTDAQGGAFHACTNCTGILNNDMTVVTGVRTLESREGSP